MSGINRSPEETAKKNFEPADDNRGELDETVRLVYDELHRQAHRYLRGERSNHTLQTTALINEAYLRLATQKNVQWTNRAQFLGLASSMMRRILVDYAKTKQRSKRGGEAEHLPLEEALTIAAETTGGETTETDLIALDKALNELAAIDPQQSRVVELRYFSGLTVEETAEVLGISMATVKRDWNVARAWLHKEIKN